MGIRDSRSRRRDRIFPAVLLVFTVLLGGVAYAKLELPEWEGDDKEENGYVLGGGLWPADSSPGEIENADNVVVMSTTEDSGSELTAGSPPPIVNSPGRAEDLAALTRPSILNTESISLKPVSGLRVPTPMLMPLRIEEVITNELPPIEGRLKDDYFSVVPADHLVDPQQLLTEQKSHDIERFLQYHAEEAKFDICLLLFGGTQEIPDDIVIEQKHAEWFGDQPVVTVAYFLAHPERTRIAYGKGIKNQLPPVVFEQIFQSCVREAQVAETAYDQVERLAIELSIRLYWMAKLLERQSAGERIASTAEELTGAGWNPSEGEGSDAVNLGNAMGGSRLTELFETFGGMPWLLVGLCGAGFIGVAGGGWWWWRRDSLAAKPMLFPELEVPSRLGGSYSGGGYIGISFDVSNRGDH